MSFSPSVCLLPVPFWTMMRCMQRWPLDQGCSPISWEWFTKARRRRRLTILGSTGPSCPFHRPHSYLSILCDAWWIDVCWEEDRHYVKTLVIAPLVHCLQQLDAWSFTNVVKSKLRLCTWSRGHLAYSKLYWLGSCNKQWSHLAQWMWSC